MGQPVVHVEIIGRDPAKLRSYYADLFGWEYDTSALVSDTVSESTDYGFVDLPGTPAGVGGGPAYAPHTVTYIGVDDVEAALARAESLGGTRVLGPARAPGRDLVIGQFRDPEGNLVGVAGAA
jgi:predicted enzyme related to lactoylglutathione lyase